MTKHSPHRQHLHLQRARGAAATLWRARGARRGQGVREQRGSVSLFYASVVIVLFLAIGLVVDGGGKIRAEQRAETVAAEAARAAGQAIDGASVIESGQLRIDPSRARAAAQSYLSSAGVQGNVQIIDGTRLRVTTTVSYDPAFVGVLGVDLTGRGDAEVRLVRGIDGGEIR